MPIATSPTIAESPSRRRAVGPDKAIARSVIGVEMTSAIHRDPAITFSRPSGVSSS